MADLELSIERMTYGADAVAHDGDGKTVFVSGAVAGDRVRAEVVREEARFSHARCMEVLEPSPERVEPACPYAGVCGGCPWAQLSYPAQARAKRANVVDALARVAHMGNEAAEGLVEDVVSPSAPWGYRNKVELGFSRAHGRAALGMHRVDDPSALARVESCRLLPQDHAKDVKALGGSLGFLAARHSDVELERVGLRVSGRTDAVEVALWTRPSAFPRAQAVKLLRNALSPTSVVRVMQKGPAKARRVAGVEALYGPGNWSERIAGGRMRLSAPSFFQVNTAGAEKLVELVLEALDPQPDERAMDLYCGAGTFTLPLARRAAFVSAVESYGPAVRDLRRNVEAAGLANVEACGGDAGREFPEGDADVIVVDPPRAGLSADVVEKLGKTSARAIAYVSCDPATLARDLARFGDQGRFSPLRVTPVDLFPQTYHVETVTLLARS